VKGASSKVPAKRDPGDLRFAGTYGRGTHKDQGSCTPMRQLRSTTCSETPVRYLGSSAVVESSPALRRSVSAVAHSYFDARCE
jgi:hypothetical protein